MAISVLQTIRGQLASQATNTFTFSPGTPFTAGSTLVLVGGGVYQDGSDTIPYLSSVSDTASNVWENISNARPNTNYFPTAFAATASNIAAGSPTISVNFTRYLNTTPLHKYSYVLFEIAGAPSSSAIDLPITTESFAGGVSSVDVGPTQTLNQADNLVIGCVAGWVGNPANPAGWTEVTSDSNGTYLGLQVSYKTISVTDPQTFSVTFDVVSSGSAGVVVVVREAAVGTLRYKFLLRSSEFTSSDTGITGYVWRNSGPDGVFAEKYENLSGDATAGVLYITDIPNTVQLGDSIIGSFYNSTDGSRPFVAGTVEVAS